jgi:hypothetical protein
MTATFVVVGACDGITGILVALLAWFAAELITAGGQTGLAERIFGAGASTVASGGGRVLPVRRQHGH